MGVSRSASTVIAYAMKQQHWSLDEALSYVRDRRSIVKPNDGFLKQLQTYSGILSARWDLTLCETPCSIKRRADVNICPFWFNESEELWCVHLRSQQRHSALWKPRQKSVRKDKGEQVDKPGGEDNDEEDDEDEDEEDVVDSPDEKDSVSPDEESNSEEEQEVIL